MAGVNLQRIALKAGVSPSTVSVILNRKDGVPVADATRRRVVKIAEHLGYQRAAMARAILTPLRQIGIIVGDPQWAQETFTAVIFQGIQQRLRGLGYHPLFYSIDAMPVTQAASESPSMAAADRVINAFRSRLVEGLILDKLFFFDHAVQRMVRAKVPLVMINGGLMDDEAGRPIPSVTMDDWKAGRLAAAHLLELRHRRIGLISRPYREGPRAFESTPVQRFREGFEEALENAGINPIASLQVEGDMLDKPATQRAVEQLMSAAEPPTALLAGDDQLAVMAINVLRSRGLRVPEDVSVMGCGNLPLIERLIEPGLTTVDLPLQDNGDRAAAMLSDLLAKKPVAEPRLVLPPELVIRQTTSINPRTV